MTWEDNQIITYISNNISRIIPTIVAIILWIITIIFMIKQNKKKRLWLFEIYKNDLIDLEETTIKNDLKISYKNNSVSKISLYVFELKNVWDIIIEKEDFIEWRVFCLMFTWVSVIGVNIKSVKPDFLKNYIIELDYSDNEIRIDPFTLDVWESIQVEVILDWTPLKIEEWYRIKWIWSLIKNNVKGKQRKIIFFLIFSFLFYLIISVLNDEAKWIRRNYFDSSNFANIRYQILFYISYLSFIVSFWFAIKYIALVKYTDSDKKEPTLISFIKRFLSN